MANIVPFESANLPAYLKNNAPVENVLGGGGGVSFPSISIKGKVFTQNRGGEKVLITKPGGDGEPAAALEVVILGVGPKAGFSRTFYANGYVEGSTEKPDCSSDDGVSPNAGTKDPQSSKCAICPQNAVGSGATQQNPKAKACKSSKMLAVAAAGQVNDPLLLKVPGASLIALGEYGDFLTKRKLHPHQVVTKIGFDYSVAYPALTFKGLGYVPPEIYPEVEKVHNSDLVAQMIGVKRTVSDEVPALPPSIEDEPPAAPVKPAAKPAAKPAKASSSMAGDDDLPAAPKAKVKVEEVPAGGPLDDALSGLSFDD